MQYEIVKLIHSNWPREENQNEFKYLKASKALGIWSSQPWEEGKWRTSFYILTQSWK